ncbi:hypothetical protein VNO77_18700 [Canavalia gladiata]|uniref:Uncharacterized protein n=1 Tax=Canavalia gladiata TaxID=3824 RepID=A0AAN9LLE4_CANGL
MHKHMVGAIVIYRSLFTNPLPWEPEENMQLVPADTSSQSKLGIAYGLCGFRSHVTFRNSTSLFLLLLTLLAEAVRERCSVASAFPLPPLGSFQDASWAFL